MKTPSCAACSPGASLAPHTIERRSLREDDVAIEILYCGVCHSDLHMVRNDWGRTLYPLVPGHEIVGRVTAVGPAVSRLSSQEHRQAAHLRIRDSEHDHARPAPGGGSLCPAGGVGQSIQCRLSGRVGAPGARLRDAGPRCRRGRSPGIGGDRRSTGWWCSGQASSVRSTASTSS